MKDKSVILIKELLDESHLISIERKNQLLQLAALVNQELQNSNKVEVNVICTHNSRRSQLGELWIREACNFFNIENINAYSGGTESTAFNHRMVNALRSFNFEIDQIKEGDNPSYLINDFKQIMFSKKYSHQQNPQSGFIAIMVCDSAEAACPIVVGAKHRVSLKYKDPKEYDDTPLESKAYSDKVREIGREILFIFREISLN